ncbi:MAG: LysM peptidoglycan-binding domain-containing protein [Rhodanobacteraceae bacterium]
MGDAKKPDFSNVQSGVSSTAPEAKKADFSNVQSGVASTAATVDPPSQTYTVNKGDTLSKIAREFYGSANRWHEIFDANRDQISNPDLIKPGQVLKIPTGAKSGK